MVWVLVWVSLLKVKVAAKGNLIEAVHAAYGAPVLELLTTATTARSKPRR